MIITSFFGSNQVCNVYSYQIKKYIPEGEKAWYRDTPTGRTRTAADTSSIGQSGSGRPKGSGGATKNRNWKASWSDYVGGWPTQSPVCHGDDGLSSRLDGIAFSKWRKESIMAGGNAIVPQLALEIFKAIEQTEIQLTPA